MWRLLLPLAFATILATPSLMRVVAERSQVAHAVAAAHGTHNPASADGCRAGRLHCVDRVIAQMRRRFDALARGCDHDAVFALTYLRTTEAYRRSAPKPGFFADPRFVNHEDAVFARYYFNAHDAWRAERPDAVPPAWRIAFGAAQDRDAPALGDMLLGINAHIQRDLPFVLAEIGLVRPDGTSRKPDHDRVNEFLDLLAGDVMREIAQRFDPSVLDTRLPEWAERLGVENLVPAWRETAWRNAERLAAAPDAAARREVARTIEHHAAAQARLILTATGYGPFGDSSARDAHCQAQRR